MKRTLIALASLTLFSCQLHAGAIHRAAKDGSRRRVEKLLSKNFLLLNSQDEQGRTALHWAAWLGFEDLALFLLKAGAQKDIRDSLGCLPLELAYIRGHEWLSEVIEHYHRSEYGDEPQSHEEYLALANRMNPPTMPSIFELFNLTPIPNVEFK